MIITLHQIVFIGHTDKHKQQPDKYKYKVVFEAVS
jgi:hypothetical protein